MLSQRTRPAARLNAADRHAPGLVEQNWKRTGPAGALNVLVADGDEAMRTVCAGMAESLGCRVHTAASVADAHNLLTQNTFDLAFIDHRVPGGGGAGLLTSLRASSPRLYVVVMGTSTSVHAAVDMMRSGANDFFEKPFSLSRVASALQELSARQQRLQQSRILEDRLQAGLAPGHITGHSRAMQKLLRIVAKVSTTRHPVLLTGERGTGKEVVARAIHANGPNAAGPFVPVDCDSLLSEHLEAMLFGVGTHEGLLSSANEGTMYLAEITSLPLAAQARLLRVLETRQLGSSTAPRPFLARLLAATSQNLELAVEQGRFRKDLYYRLNIVNLRVPPLRERLEDLVSLTEQFLEKHRQEYSIPFIFSSNGLESMERYDWPGNITELQSVIERACSMSNDQVLHFEDLTTPVQQFKPDTSEPESSASPAATEQLLNLQQLEREAIVAALNRLHGDKIQAARLLGIGKTTLYRKLKEYGLADGTH